MQEDRPIAFFSKALAPPSRLKSAYEREFMGVILTIQKWRHYLLGRHFAVRTNQQSLRFLMNQRQLPPEQLR